MMPEFLFVDTESPWFWIGMVFFACWLLQMLYWWLVFARSAFFKAGSSPTHTPPVSVVISARNEYAQLEKHLERIITQDYPEFEVIVVNDHSADDTVFLLQDFSEKFSNFTAINLREAVTFVRGKKFPLSVGIKSARHDLLLFTDADCYPVSNQWIRGMVQSYAETGENIVLGYGGYEARKGFLNKLIRYDTLHTAMQYMGFALSGLPYMGVGRNIMYHRNLFYRQKGFTSHYTLAGGDDDLFVNQVAKRKNTRVAISPESKTLSLPKTNFTDWVRQKKRHLSTAPNYRFLHKLMLGLYWLSHSGFYGLFILLALAGFMWVYILAAFVFRFISMLVLVKKNTRQFGEKKLLLFSPLIDVLYVFLNPYIFIGARFGKQVKWK